MSAFPMISNCIIYKKVPDHPELCNLIDVLQEEDYLVDRQTVRFARELDGKKDPYRIPGYSVKDVREMLAFFEEAGLLRTNRIMIDSGTIAFPVWRLNGRVSYGARILAKFAHLLLMICWLPTLVIGIILCRHMFSMPHAEWAPVLGILAGTIPGVLLHELGHAIAAVACGSRVYELGGIHPIHPSGGIYCCLFRGAFKPEIVPNQCGRSSMQFFSGGSVNAALCAESCR